MARPPRSRPAASDASKSDRAPTGEQDRPESFLSREDWLQAAIRLLIDEGIDQVKILRLSQALATSRGSFYWHFRDRADLLAALLRRWEERNTEALTDALGPADRPLEDRILSLFGLWVDSLYPRFDNAIRAWAAASPDVQRVQRAADERRRRRIVGMFAEAGYPADEAEVRGNILYFTQVGYYVLDLGESPAQRFTRLPGYYFAYTGRPLSAAAVERFRASQGLVRPP